MPRLVALVKGRVQGVGYRAFAQKKALELGLSGYAENLPDGRVEVVAEGPKEALELFLHHLKQGPRLARVEAVEVQWGEEAGLKGFHVYCAQAWGRTPRSSRARARASLSSLSPVPLRADTGTPPRRSPRK